MRANSKMIALALISLTVFSAACSHQKVHQVGTHKVTVSRHGFEKQLRVDTSGAVPTFEYSGVSTTGEGMKVSITGDKVKVNGKDGMLRPGDTVFIGDDGVLVNSLDYGESAKYLQANNSTKSPSSTN